MEINKMKNKNNDYIQLKLWKVCNEITYRFLSPHNKLGKILSFKGWGLEDFASEFYLHILEHNRNSTNRFREKWLTDWWDWDDIGLQKQFRAWTKIEVKAFVGRLYYREFMRHKDESKQALCFTYVPDYQMLVATTPLGELMFETNERINVIDNYITNYATEEEKFIYLYNTGVLALDWNDKKNKVMNYPTGPIGKKTFYARRLDLIKKLKEGTGYE
jgi:hypothetical protein